MAGMSGLGYFQMNNVTGVVASQLLQTDANTPQDVISNTSGTPLGIFVNALNFAGGTAGQILISDAAGNLTLQTNPGVSVTGTGTANATGPIVSSSVTMTFSKDGNQVRANVPALLATGDSSATPITITAIVPAAFRPSATTQSSLVNIEDNGTFLPGYATVSSAGTVVYTRSNGGAWSSNAAVSLNGWPTHQLAWLVI